MRSRRTLKCISLSLCLTIGLFKTSSGWAVDLLAAYQQALKSDPTLQSAQFSAMASKAAIGTALSPLLPQASYSYDTGYNKVKQLSDAPESIRGDHDFNSHGWTLAASQTLFDYANWKAFQESKSNAKASLASYNASLQDLMVRTSSAYFDILLAQDILRYTLAEKEAVKEQLDQTEDQYKVGLIAVTSVYQARAAYDDILAEVITAKNNIVNAKERLRRITGEYYTDIQGLGKTIPLIAPEPIDPEAWVQIAERQNYTIQAARYTKAAAEENIKEQRAGHLPTVDAVGSWGYENAGSPGFENVDSQTLYGGVSIEVPILTGGGVVASTRQASYLADQATADLEAARRDVIQSTHASYNDIIAGISRIKADKQAIVSNKSSLESTEAAYSVGSNTILDVLQAQQDLFDAQRQYSNDLYAYLNAVLNLKRAAGTISVADIAEINSWMTQKRSDSSVTYSPKLPIPPTQSQLAKQ